MIIVLCNVRLNYIVVVKNHFVIRTFFSTINYTVLLYFGNYFERWCKIEIFI